MSFKNPSKLRPSDDLWKRIQNKLFESDYIFSCTILFTKTILLRYKIMKGENSGFIILETIFGRIEIKNKCMVVGSTVLDLSFFLKIKLRINVLFYAKNKNNP